MGGDIQLGTLSAGGETYIPVRTSAHIFSPWCKRALLFLVVLSIHPEKQPSQIIMIILLVGIVQSVYLHTSLRHINTVKHPLFSSHRWSTESAGVVCNCFMLIQQKMQSLTIFPNHSIASSLHIPCFRCPSTCPTHDLTILDLWPLWPSHRSKATRDFLGTRGA